MMRLNRNNYNNIISLQNHNHQIDQHDLTATRSSAAEEMISEPFHTPHVNDAGAFLISSPHAPFFSKAPNQQDDQYSYQPSYAPIRTSTIDTAAATNPTATPPNPTNSIISFRAEVSSMVADERKPGGARESFHNNPLTSSELSNQICVLRRTSICFMPLCSDSDSENRDFDVALDNFFRDKASELQPSGPVSVSSSALSQQPLVLC